MQVSTRDHNVVALSNTIQHAVSPADFTASEATGEFPVCTTSLCVDIVIKDDTTLEKEETFYVLVMLGLGEEVFLPNITLTQEEATVSILDNDDGGGNKECLQYPKQEVNYSLGKPLSSYPNAHVILCNSNTSLLCIFKSR